MGFNSFIKRHEDLKQHLLVALALTAISLAIYSLVDYGNAFGIDDWAHFYNIYHNASPNYSDRPLALILFEFLSPILTTNFLAYHLVLLALRAASGFLVYSLVRQLIPRQPLFAFTCGLVSCVFIVRDSFFLVSLFLTNDNYASVIFTLLALNLHTAYMQNTQGPVAKRSIYFIASLGLACATPLVREATLPLLFTVPIIIFVCQHQFSRARIMGVLAWCGIVVGTALHYVLPVFGLAKPTYGSQMFVSLAPQRLLSGTQNQFDFAFRSLAQLDSHAIYQNRLPVFLTVCIVLLCFLIVRSKIQDQDDDLNYRATWLSYIVWMTGGVLAAWLGFAAYLPSIYATSPTRTHMLSIAGEAIVLTASLWLVSRLRNKTSWRLIVQVLGLVFIATYGTVTIANSQLELYSYAATWDNLAYFMRSLAHLAPAVQQPTLFVYIENRNLEETPFVSGFSFQYAARYFYNDTATALMPADNIFGDWQVSDAGIDMHEKWVDTPHLYQWNEMIFITRDDTGRLLILTTLPDKFYSPSRQAMYQPGARIQNAFISNRTHAAFPALSSADWSEHDYLLQNKP
jgi:hypothetical protein